MEIEHAAGEVVGNCILDIVHGGHPIIRVGVVDVEEVEYIGEF